jgi:hypothetical protein
MVLALAEAGFKIYSDEICPIHHHTGRVHPFPRSLWVVAEERSEGPGRDRLVVRGGKVQLPSAGPAVDRTDDGTAAPVLVVPLNRGGLRLS